MVVADTASGAPEEGAHGESALLVDGAGDGQAVLGEEAVELPLGHGLVVLPAVPRVVQRHLEVVPAPARRLLLLVRQLPLPAAGAVPRRILAAVRRHRLHDSSMCINGSLYHFWVGLSDSLGGVILERREIYRLAGRFDHCWLARGNRAGGGRLL